jgi:serine/threonine protein kinase
MAATSGAAAEVHVANTVSVDSDALPTSVPHCFRELTGDASALDIDFDGGACYECDDREKNWWWRGQWNYTVTGEAKPVVVHKSVMEPTTMAQDVELLRRTVQMSQAAAVDELHEVRGARHIAKVLSVVQSLCEEKVMYVVLEGCNTTLYDDVKKGSRDHANLKFVGDLCSAVGYLHAHEWAHRALSPRAVWFADKKLLLRDLGNVLVPAATTTTLVSVTFARKWSAPVALRGTDGRHGQKGDLWAVAWLLACAYIPRLLFPSAEGISDEQFRELDSADMTWSVSDLVKRLLAWRCARAHSSAAATAAAARAGQCVHSRVRVE